MSWMQNLYLTYENCQANIGAVDEEGHRPLLPICHITAQAQIEIVIDGEGNFRRASIVSKKDSTTIIPCTEESAGRTNNLQNHPLCDKLQYIAGDFVEHGGNVTSVSSQDPKEPYHTYLKDLADWCDSPYAHPKAQAVLAYVQKGTLIRDLVRHKVLFVGEDSKFLDKGEMEREKGVLDIFSLMGNNSQDGAFVRWRIETSDELEPRTWRDPTLWESWIHYYLNQLDTDKDKALCFITGKDQVPTNNNPRYIRREGDGAKLISSNDEANYTFRGRFVNAEQACTVGLEASQKSHYALSWLISRQGYVKGDLAIVAWATSGVDIPQPVDDPLTLLYGDAPEEIDQNINTAQEIAIQLKKRIAGYGMKIGETDKVVVMALDSATKGRLSITYYRELTGSDFLKRVNEWHESCAWLHTYRIIQKKVVPFIGAPAPSDIAEAAYGSRIDDRLRNATISRILPCIIDGQPLPRDLVESTVRRACNRVGLDEYDWNKALSIACSLFRKHSRKEHYNMALDLNRTSRDYLYGRLLALADSLESWALREGEEKRDTNAARLMQRFSERPYSTWRNLELALSPYKARLGSKANGLQRMIDEVIASFKEQDFLSDKRLSGEFLLGYHCQREYLHEKRASAKDTQDSESAQVAAE